MSDRLSDQAHNELSILCHSIEVATDEHGDGATLMLGPASRLAEGLAPWIVAREDAAEQRGAERVAAAVDEHLPHEWRDDVSLRDMWSRIADLRAALAHPSTDPDG